MRMGALSTAQRARAYRSALFLDKWDVRGIQAVRAGDLYRQHAVRFQSILKRLRYGTH